MTDKTNQKTTYKVQDGKLCIEHHILLQQLHFRKKTKNEYKDYYSYFIKLPLPIYDLLSPTDDTIYLKKEENKIIMSKTADNEAKKVRIQVDNRSLDNKTEFNRYKLTIPKKFIEEKNYKRGKSHITCQIISSNNHTGYQITLKQHNQ